MRTTFLFRRSFFLFYYLVRRTFLFRRSFFLFYYLVRTTFFYFVCRFFSLLLSRAHDFFRMSFFLFYCLVRTTYWFIFWWKATFTPDSRPTPDQFLWLGRVWLGKKLPALIEERIYPRSTPAVSALYPWCTHAQISLFPTYPRPFGWPIPALHDRPPTYSWYNYAHYAQYRTNPRSVCLISTTGLKWIIKAA